MDTFANPLHSADPIIFPQHPSFEDFNYNSNSSNNSIRPATEHIPAIKMSSSQHDLNPNTDFSPNMISQSHLHNGKQQQHSHPPQQQQQFNPEKAGYDTSQMYDIKRKQMLANSNNSQMNIKNEIQDIYGIDPQHVPVPNISANGNLLRTPRTQLAQNASLPPQSQWTIPQEPSNATITPQMAVAIMGDKDNVSQRQMAQLQQLQATYGSLQTHLIKPSDSDDLQRVIAGSISYSPGKIPGTLSGNSKSSDNYASSPTSLVTSLADAKNINNHMNNQHPSSILPQTIQRRMSLKPSGISSQSSGVTTPYQDSFNPTPMQQNFNFNAPQKPQQKLSQQQPQQFMAQQKFPPQQPHHNNNNGNGSNGLGISQQSQQPPPPPPQARHQSQAFSNQPTPTVFSEQSYEPKSRSDILNEEVKRNLSNIAIVRLLRFNDLLTCRHEKPSLPYLRHVVGEFFSENATLEICLKYANENRTYRISYSLIPLLYYRYLENVQMFELSQKFINATLLPNGSTLIDTDHFSFKCVFEDGSYCNHFGSLKIRMNRNLMFEKIDLVTDYNVHGLEYAALEKFLTEYELNNKNSGMPSSSQVKEHFKCISNLTKFGIEEELLRLLQISDVMTLAKPLVNFYVDSKSSSPLEALDAFNKVNFPEFQQLSAINTKNRVQMNPNGVAPRMTPNTSFQQMNNPTYPMTQNLQRNFNGAPPPPSHVSQQQIHIQQQQQLQPPNQMSTPVRPKQNSASGSFASKSTGSKVTLSDGAGFTNSIGSISVPLKRTSSEGNSVAQIVTRKANKKFKLQAPPAPKSNKRSKESPTNKDVKQSSNGKIMSMKKGNDGNNNEDSLLSSLIDTDLNKHGNNGLDFTNLAENS